MKVSVSNAEIAILIELQNRRLTRHLETQKPFKFNKEKDGVEGSFIDYFWNPPLDYAVFLDGVIVERGYSKLHLTRRQQKRDQLVTEALERRGITNPVARKPTNFSRGRNCDHKSFKYRRP